MLSRLVRLTTSPVISSTSWPLRARGVLGFLLLEPSIVGGALGLILRLAGDLCG